MLRTEHEIHQDCIDNFRDLGLTIGNIKNDVMYKQFFGLSPELTSLVWDLLTNPKIHVRLLPKHLLWALMFLKQYTNEGVLSGLAKVSPKTFRKWVRIVVHGLSSWYESFVSKCFTPIYLHHFILFYYILFYLSLSSLLSIRFCGKIGRLEIMEAYARSLWMGLTSGSSSPHRFRRNGFPTSLRGPVFDTR